MFFYEDLFVVSVVIFFFRGVVIDEVFVFLWVILNLLRKGGREVEREGKEIRRRIRGLG